MHIGYVKVWRKIADAGWLQNHKLCAFWLWCLIKASHKEYDMVVGFQNVHLMSGDFIFGRQKAAEELEMSERSIRTCLDMLKNSGNLTIKTTNKFSIISIVNWDAYQQTETQDDQQDDQPPTNNRPATDHKQTLKAHKNKTYTSDFLSFYNAYPKRVGKDAAWKAWNNRKDSLPELNIILTAIEAQKKSDAWMNENGKYIPHPATWINQGRWQDEIKVEKKASW